MKEDSSARVYKKEENVQIPTKNICYFCFTPTKLLMLKKTFDRGIIGTFYIVISWRFYMNCNPHSIRDELVAY